MKTIPVFKDYLWGGDKLPTRFGKETDMRPVAESWEISAYKGSSCTIGNGEFAGRTLFDVINEHPGLTGGRTDFPLLIKLLDARDKLSLQVHPDDAYARKDGERFGKNELWYVLEAEGAAELILGFKEPLSRGELEAAIKDGTVLQKVNHVPVKAGDSFPIPAGLLHAVGAGTVIAEIQQSSDLTYRVYDYGRTGADGKPRALHIEKALDVTVTDLKTENTRGRNVGEHNGYSVERLTDWDFFTAKLLKIRGCAELGQNDKGFSCLLVLDGGLTLGYTGSKLFLKPGDSVFIPAGLGEYTLAGTASALLAEAD